jgi:tetratricopeptide (TPR) repeat protein
MHEAQGDYARAEPLYRQAMEITKDAIGEKTTEYAYDLTALANLYSRYGDYARAEPLFRQALEIRKKLSPRHRDLATSLDRLASVYEAQGDYARAEPLYRQAMEINKRLGESHLNYAVSLNNLGLLYLRQGDYARAELNLRQALEISKDALGEAHLHHGISLTNLGLMFQSQSDYARAEPLYREALDITYNNLQLACATQSGHGQLLMATDARHKLDCYLAMAVRADDFHTRVYERIITWKGMILARQQALKTVSRRADLAPLAAELQSTTSRLARLALNTAPPEQVETWRNQINELHANKESLEKKLSVASGDFLAAIKPVTLADLQGALPPNGAIVDFIEYQTVETKVNEEGSAREVVRRIAAFVIPSVDGVDPKDPAAVSTKQVDSVVRLVDLGPAKLFEDAIAVWRSGLGSSAESRAAASLLRTKLWLPIEEHLAGVKTVLISPDGDLGKLPFAALPGKEPGTYLLEDYAIAVVPAARLIVGFDGPAEPDAATNPSVATSPAGGPTRRAGTTGNLLVLGGVDYDLRAAEAPVRGASRARRSGSAFRAAGGHEGGAVHDRETLPHHVRQRRHPVARRRRGDPGCVYATCASASLSAPGYARLLCFAAL